MRSSRSCCPTVALGCCATASSSRSARLDADLVSLFSASHRKLSHLTPQVRIQTRLPARQRPSQARRRRLRRRWTHARRTTRRASRQRREQSAAAAHRREWGRNRIPHPRRRVSILSTRQPLRRPPRTPKGPRPSRCGARGSRWGCCSTTAWVVVALEVAREVAACLELWCCFSSLSSWAPSTATCCQSCGRCTYAPTSDGTRRNVRITEHRLDLSAPVQPSM